MRTQTIHPLLQNTSKQELEYGSDSGKEPEGTRNDVFRYDDYVRMLHTIDFTNREYTNTSWSTTAVA